ncbi:MAG: streptomycin 6-kinase [Thermoleophilaceae bacterium]|nr:streptomycin 6-kinase [Thermoleophilaceae bacterium]
MRDRDEEWAAWVDGLPALAAGLMEEWGLLPDGPAMNGYCSLVLPVTTSEDTPAVLKLVGFPDEESEHEHLALQRWHGDGTVLLYRADPRRRALLLERLQTRNLETLPDEEACEVVAGLYPRIHVPALPQLRTLTSYVGQWTDDLATLPRDSAIPRRLVEQTLSLARDLLADPASVGVLIHGDLHGQNVLAADREPWLVIDPKPMSGDPHYEPAPMLWNRIQKEQRTGGDLRVLLLRLFHTLVDVAGLDEDRARAWVVVRMVLNASWTVLEADGPLDADDQEWITTCVTIAKAVQD